MTVTRTVSAAIMRRFDCFRERFLLGVARTEYVERRLDNLYAQLAGLAHIQIAMSRGLALKPLRGWAISPDAMALILAEAQAHVTPQMVEFGCGQSTVLLAAWAKHYGGRLTTFEHDPAYAESIRRQLQGSDLTSYV